MSFSTARLTCYAVLSAMEDDLRATIRQHVQRQGSAQLLLGKEVWDKCCKRLANAGGFGDDRASLDELLPFTDFADLYHLLNAQAVDLPSEVAAHLRANTPQLDRLVPIRNRVAHSRPLEYEDLSV